MGSSTLDLNGLLNSLPDIVMKAYLNITLTTVNLQNIMVTKHIQVTLINHNLIEIALAQDSIKVAP